MRLQFSFLNIFKNYLGIYHFPKKVWVDPNIWGPAFEKYIIVDLFKNVFILQKVSKVILDLYIVYDSHQMENSMLLDLKMAHLDYGKLK